MIAELQTRTQNLDVALDSRADIIKTATRL
jgi:hypothetical protein